MGCVYKLVNRQNGLTYVVQVCVPGKTFNDRLNEHCKNARNNCTNLLSCAIREFGIESFDCDVLIIDDDPQKLDDLERQYIEEFNTNATNGGHGYNMTSGGQGTSGFKWSEQSRDKKRKICPIARDELITLGQRLTTQEIATQFCVASSTVTSWFDRYDLVKPKLQRLINNQHSGAWTYESEMNLLKMYNEGKSYEEIAETLNRSVSAIAVKNARLRKKFNLIGGPRRRKNQHMSEFKWVKR